MPRTINLKGTNGKTYNLDEISTENTRTDSSKELVVEVWYWNPNLKNSHKSPNPPNPEIGRIWLSQLIDESNPKYNEIKDIE